VPDSSPGRFTVKIVDGLSRALTGNPAAGWVADPDPCGVGAGFERLMSSGATDFEEFRLDARATLSGLEVEARVGTGAAAGATAVGIGVDTSPDVPETGSVLGTGLPSPADVSTLFSLVCGTDADPAPVWVAVDPVPAGDVGTGVDGGTTGGVLSSVEAPSSIGPLGKRCRVSSSHSEIVPVGAGCALASQESSSRDAPIVELELPVTEETEVGTLSRSVRSSDSEDKLPEGLCSTPIRAGRWSAP
jgi:hypothetical protein